MNAGGSPDLGTFNISDTTGAAAATRITATISYTDSGGRAGAATGATDVRELVAIQRFSLVGFVVDGRTRAGIAGARVSVQSGPDAGQSTTTASTGYYAFSALQAGTFALNAQATGMVTGAQTVTLSANAQQDFTLGPEAPAVEYRITGSARRCSATYQNSTGGTNQAEVNIPFSYTWSTARTGDFLYISCQIDTGGDRGDILVEIYRNGTIYKSATASGFPNIAAASGSY